MSSVSDVHADRFIAIEAPFEEAVRHVLRLHREGGGLHAIFLQQLRELGVDWREENWQSIPLVPIQAFREQILLLDSSKAGKTASDLEFRSSGTTGRATARHFIGDDALLRESILRGFRHVYGPPDRRPVVLGFLPGYVENPHSSLVHMLTTLVEEQAPFHGVIPICHTHEHLSKHLEAFHEAQRPIILFGAAFGLLDFLDVMERVHVPTDGGRQTSISVQNPSPHQGAFPLPSGSIVIETGGMKTYRREIGKQELRERLSGGFQLPMESIHSEFGMAEMSSQAYARGSEFLEPVPWLRFHIRHIENPLLECEPGQTGLLGFTDLANVHSCPFVLTEDLAEKDEQGRVRILGRWKGADLRGCNFLVERDA